MVMNLTKTLLKNIDNKEIISYNVRFDNGFEVEILNLGGIITKIITPDKNGNLENIVVGYKDIESYIQNPSYFGAIIGRTSGRICEGKISIDGVDYDLAKNYNPHQGHGGDKGFNSKIWDVKILEEETEKAGITVQDAIQKEHFDIAICKTSMANCIISMKKIQRINFLEIFEKMFFLLFLLRSISHNTKISHRKLIVFIRCMSPP